MTCCEIGHNIHYIMPHRGGGGGGGGGVGRGQWRGNLKHILNIPVTSRAAPVM